MQNELDKRLLRHLQNDPEMPMSELAERCNTTSVTAARRLAGLSEQGVLRGQQAIIDWARLGYTVEVSLRVTLDKTHARAFDEFLNDARNVPEAIEIQTFLGRVDVRLSVIAFDMAHYQNIYRARILTLPHIADIEALMHIATIKTDQVLPI